MANGGVRRQGLLIPEVVELDPSEAEAIAARAGVPIVPVGVRGAFEAFPRRARVPRPRPVSVAYGEPIAVPRSAARSRDEQVRVAATLMRRIAELCGRVG